MDIAASLLRALLGRQSVPLYVAAAVTVILVAARLRGDGRRRRGRFPEINPRKRFELTSSRRVQAFISRSRETLAAARARYPDRPFRIHSDLGELVVVPWRLLDELAGSPKLDFRRIVRDVRPPVQAAAPALPCLGSLMRRRTRTPTSPASTPLAPTRASRTSP